MDPRAEAFEWHVLGPVDHGVPELVEALDGVNQGLDVLLDGDVRPVRGLASTNSIDRAGVSIAMSSKTR